MASFTLNRQGERALVLLLALLLALWWQQAFLGITAAAAGSREADQFRTISQLTAAAPERYSPRPRLFNLSDRMETAAGRTPAPPQPWGDAEDLGQRLLRPPVPPVLWLAATGPEPVVRRRLRPMERQVEQAGFRCQAIAAERPFMRLLQCRSAATAQRPPRLPAP